MKVEIGCALVLIIDGVPRGTQPVAMPDELRQIAQNFLNSLPDDLLRRTSGAGPGPADQPDDEPAP